MRHAGGKTGSPRVEWHARLRGRASPWRDGTEASANRAPPTSDHPGPGDPPCRRRAMARSGTRFDHDPVGRRCASRLLSAVSPWTVALHVQVTHVLGVLLDEVATRLHLVAHEAVEQAGRDRRVLDLDLHDGPRLRIHRRLPELIRVHLAQALVPLEPDPLRIVRGAAESLDVVHALLLVVRIELLLALLDPVERRLRDVDEAGHDELRHLTEEEREQEGTDVRAVDVGIGHDDDLVVARVLELELVTDARADRRDDGADLVVREDPVDPGALDVEDLALEREDRLVGAVPSLLRAAAGRVSLDEVDLAHRRVADRAVRELPREDATLERALLARQIPRAASRFPRPRRLQRLVDDPPRGLRVLVEEDREVLVHRGLDGAPDLAVAELGLGLPLELRLHHPDAEHARQALADVLSGQALVLLEQLVAPRVVVDRAGERRLEAGQVRAALVRADGVDEGVRVFAEALVVLERELDLGLGL